jgi:hypothetical protein
LSVKASNGLGWTTIWSQVSLPQGSRCKTAQRKLCSVFGERTYSLSSMKRWIRQFKDGDLSCEDKDRSARPSWTSRRGFNGTWRSFPSRPSRNWWGIALPRWLQFAESSERTRNSQKFSRRWLSHDLTHSQTGKVSEELLHVLRNGESARLWHVATGDESWSSYRYQSAHCYAKSRMEVPPRAKTTITIEPDDNS